MSDIYSHQFEPVFNSSSKVLILGTFPSVKSRENNFYYAHPQNRFWTIISMIVEKELPKTVEDKKKILLENKIAVWDVINSCSIVGSSDSSIRDVIPADLTKILNSAEIKKIYANGATAKKLYEKYQKNITGIDIIGLPSTSPANAAYSIDKLIKSWIQIKDDLK